MVRISSVISGLALAMAVAAVPHKEVEGFEEDAPELYLKYKPFLKVKHGCVPFPAVDKDDGGISDGLKPAGASNGECSSSEGQIYARGKEFPNSFAIMYAWYMPKDQPVNGVQGGGHRHEWESVVVWLSGKTSEAEYLGVAWSGHGGYSTEKAEDSEDGNFSDGRPLIAYNTDGVMNHELHLGTEEGGEQPLIEWEAIGKTARQALTNADFGDANVPLKDGNFEDNLSKASL